jgi:hypothetical protein
MSSEPRSLPSTQMHRRLRNRKVDHYVRIFGALCDHNDIHAGIVPGICQHDAHVSDGVGALSFSFSQER